MQNESVKHHARRTTWNIGSLAKTIACGALALGAEVVAGQSHSFPRRHGRGHRLGTDRLEELRSPALSIPAADNALPAVALPAPICAFGETPGPGCPPTVSPELQGTFAMCLIVRDQPLDVPEWVEHHRALGASAFYLFDHATVPPMYEALKPTLSQGDVVYRYFNADDGENRPQTHVYDACIQDYGKRHQFMAFLDTDEFIILRQGRTSLPQFLLEYADAGALAINWRQFGSSGHVSRPPGRVVDSYTQCFPAEHSNCRHVKLIANMHYTVAAEGPHTAIFRDNHTAVNENHETVIGPFTEVPSMEKIAIYHYVLKSREDFQHKVERGAAFNTIGKTFEFFDLVDQDSTAICLEARNASLV